ncbi:MAG: hypothetical protein U0821_21910 [Chloroflexota bacterium]
MQDHIEPGWVVPGKGLLVKIGLLGPTVELPALRCECGGDALPIDSSYDAQKDTIIYLCPDCRSSWVDQVH